MQHMDLLLDCSSVSTVLQKIKYCGERLYRVFCSFCNYFKKTG